jgi:CRISPR-associated exonuclease Cas4
MTVCASQAGESPRLGRSLNPSIQVPLSALEHYEYCPRQAGLILLEDGYADNADTVRGSLLHQHVHEPGSETREGVRTLWALPVWHEGLGLTGVCDAVELHADGRIMPVEHKSGDYVAGGPADVQLAGQAMCLEEMFHTSIPIGTIFSVTDRRRHKVNISGPLRARVMLAAQEVRTVMLRNELAPPVADSRCRRCSMNHLCLPRVLARRRAYAQAEENLFNVGAEAQDSWHE